VRGKGEYIQETVCKRRGMLPMRPADFPEKKTESVCGRDRNEGNQRRKTKRQTEQKNILSVHEGFTLKSIT
jgi:hypothetical protein